MCFSAPASFVTAGLTGAIGIIALTRASEPRQLPFAATPLFFAVQQGIEGLLWLNLPLAPDGHLSTALAFSYLVFAEAFWPVFVPIAVWLIEPSQFLFKTRSIPNALVAARSNVRIRGRSGHDIVVPALPILTPSETSAGFVEVSFGVGHAAVRVHDPERPRPPHSAGCSGATTRNGIG